MYKTVMCLFAAALTASSGIAFAGDWYQYHGPNRDRISTESGWKSIWTGSEPPILWRTNIGYGFASMAVADGRVYAMGNRDDIDTIYCFDAVSGEEVWKHSYPSERFSHMHEGGPCGTPTVIGGTVYTVGKNGDMFALDAKTGEVKWMKQLRAEYGAELPRWRFSTSPLVEDGKVVVDVGKIVAMDKDTGETVWVSDNFESAYSSPIAFDLNGKRCIGVFPRSGFVALGAESGETLARYDWETQYGVNAATPIVNGDRFFVSSGYGSGGAVFQISDDFSVREIWKNTNMRNQMNSSVLWEGHLYGFDEGILKCLDFATGEERWRERGLGKGSLMLADGKLIVLSERGELIVAEATPEGFEPTGRTQALDGKCWTIPVLSNGLIYCRNAEGDLVCVDVRG